MGRKSKSTNNQQTNASIETTDAYSSIFSKLDSYLEKEYGVSTIPDPFIVSFGVKPLDAILGGGLLTGMFTMLTSPPETGKSAISWQLIKRMLDDYPNAFAIYLDIEGAANISNDNLGLKSRIEMFNIDPKRVKHIQLPLYIEDVHDIIEGIVEEKRKIEEKIGEHFPAIIVWDSIAETPPKKILDADNPEQLTGYKARILQHILSKLHVHITMNNILLLAVDQVRANMSNAMMYQKTEKSVGEFNNLKSATSSTYTGHKVRQWLYLSKQSEILPADLPGVDGWYLDIFTEKCKLAPSKQTIRVVFDKRYGIDKFWSEFTFLSQYTPTEKKIIRKLEKTSQSSLKMYLSSLPPLTFQTNGSWASLEIVDPETGEVIDSYDKKFYKKDVKVLYDTDTKFREVFNKAVDFHVQHRIIKHFQNPYLFQSTELDNEGDISN